MDLLLGAKQQTHLHKILLLQKRALQIKNFLDRRDHAIPLFIDANVLPLNFLYSQIISNLMHDVHNNMVPSGILNLFQKQVAATTTIQEYQLQEILMLTVPI